MADNDYDAIVVGSGISGNKVLRHISIPGHYDGNLNYTPGDRAWA